MVSETFDLQNEKEVVLSGVIDTLHPRKKQPAIIFLNGFLDTMHSSRKKYISNLFLEKGFVTVRFDYTYGFGKGAGEVAEFTLTSQILDAERVIEYVSRRGYVDSEKIVIFGHCFGGMATILLSAFDDRVKAVITLSAPYSFGDTRLTRLEPHDMSRIQLKRYFHIFSETLKKDVRIDFSFFEDGFKKDMPRAVRNLKQPILILHGEKDQSIPPSNAQEIYDRVAGEREIHFIKGMEHHPTMKDAKVIAPLTLSFLKKHLKI